MTYFELDARRLLCPMPIIKAQNKTRELQHGDQLTIIATDPGAMYDLPSWCRINGHKIINCENTGDEIHITIEIVKDG
ncbi:sulfurtransferase TusA family protein [Legionella israelensis]|uniref:Sulfurtransferase TusA n=1 Tax=Legionella israelensis TaxID=454 RepID=A0A0W0WNH1_9GAMM|nr:sulfurtransferase TusA family protein [Legionella israelensis]KTD33869.1 Sulfurtransferase TusA [Legionella israelensis]QBS08964.1 sulfurtransferase TusA family protein [Legionella israelensis]SCX81547.1 tRNA 2-thiouridine synthesizing protein A [Legionella israelensis DSM 19235]STX58656.1 Sulfurtransferase TusA [Legionella israelensis]